jgi:uncharacterized membrane protein YgcG
MNLLTKYSPAETLTVMQGSKATLKDLVKTTFLDLLLKKVIRTIDVPRQPHPNDPEVSYKYVVIGTSFYTYQPLPHEKIFVSPFFADGSVQILFRNYVKLLYQKAATASYFQYHIRKSPNLMPHYTQTFWQRLVGNYSPTAYGIEAKEKLGQEMAALETTFPALIESDKTRAVEVWKQIKGNVFLLSTVDFALLQQIDQEVLKELNAEQPVGDDGWSASVSGCSSWNSFGDCSDSFDSSCGGDSGCSSDGGGGDSGCSSGCGGGCGGGGD